MNTGRNRSSKPTARGSISRVKSGCKTCKIRRVKCDEKRPACQRCLSTGRTCDGYGIWDGGGRRRSLTSSHAAQPLTQPPSISRHNTRAGVLSLSHDEHRQFEWFARRTTGRLPGVFTCALFWETLVLQASSTEPAVLYAVLALGAAHRMEIANACCCKVESEDSELSNVTTQKRLALQYYNKAISLLRPQLCDRRPESVRISLVVCIIFIYLEFMQERYKDGYVHFRHGLQLLDLLIPGLSSGSRSFRDCADESLAETLAWLDIQTTLLKTNSSQGQYPRKLPSWHDPEVPTAFRDILHARQSMDRLLFRSYALEEESRQISSNPATSFDLLGSQKRLRNDLAFWSRTFTAYTKKMWPVVRDRDKVAYSYLPVYREMAFIIAETCLCPTDESIFDSYTTNFAFIVSAMKGILEAMLPAPLAHVASRHCTQRFSYSAQMDLIPPLYYTAMNCRVPSIRRQAVELVTTGLHEEGIWDTSLSAQMAREIVSLEEQGSCVQYE
ncbi:C6 zinc finger domain-containing protein [Colletotrichum kahawae]|uniref:C6 zinc finger domain-containing protein n=1 Tax=Colletotrichum kahawae TaxID=34407 RepID=A0AAD9YXP8_COLKA|nr:C6 zinc finger domain-containing protein [Colletotrichum kahawae]